MLERIRFRWLLPLLMTAVQLVLFALTAMQERAHPQRSALSIPVVRAAVIQEEGRTVNFQPITPPPIPPLTKAAIILNFPALIGGMIVSEVFNRESDASIIGFGLLFVPFVWWPIGSWVDRQIAGVSVARKGIASRVGRWALRVVAVLALIGVLFSSHGGWDGHEDFFYIPIGLWSTWYLFCSFWGDNRLRRLRAEDVAEVTG
jgi:hypothetical protein